MMRYELGKWNLDELVKNPTRLTIDKKLEEIEKNTKKFTSVKKNLSPNISSTKFLKLLHDLEHILEKSGMVGGYSSYAILKIHSLMRPHHYLCESRSLVLR